MPKRTNQFQRLAAVIHGRLSKAWEVEESRMLRDLSTGQEREVDVVALATVMEHKLFLCIECRDHARPADVTWVEAMAKKHESLPTSKLVLWSRNGFSRTAISKARLFKIDLVSAKDVEKTDWAAKARSMVGAQVRLVSPAFRPFIDVKHPNGSFERIDNAFDAQWFRKSGELVGAMPALLQILLTDDAVSTTMLDHAPLGSGDFWVQYCPPNGEEWFVKNAQGIAMEVSRVGVGIRTMTEQLPLDVASTPYGGKVLTLATATKPNGTRFDFYVEESSDGSSTVDASQTNTSSEADS